MKITLSVLALISSVLAIAAAPEKKLQTAVFAGGCFWCTEADFEKVPGVISAQSGYIGGKEKNPTYEQVSSHATSHVEAVQINFDANAVSYAQLLEHYWRTIDPTVKDRQFCDTGAQYRSAIFYLDDEQKKLAQASKAALEKSGALKLPIQTQIIAATHFWPAEDYHQDYYKKNPVRYKWYRSGCGRDKRLKELWSR